MRVPEISDVQKPEGPDFFDFAPGNQLHPILQMKTKRADPHGPVDGFLDEPGIEQAARE